MLSISPSSSRMMAMPYRNLLRFTLPLAACGVLLAGAAPARPQDSQSQSVADAARRARQQKKTSPKSSKVITDDDLDMRNAQARPGGVNVVGPPQLETEPPSPAAVAKVEAADEAADKDAARNVPGEDPEIAAVKEQIAIAEKELDLLQREFALDQDTFYSKTGFASDAAGIAKLDAEKQQISDKQQQVEALKTRLAALLELKGRNRGRAKATPPASSTPAQSDKSSPPQSR
jgi:hypothetical protein